MIQPSRQMDVRQQLAQVVHPPVTTVTDQFQRIVAARIGSDQLLLVVPVQTAIPVHAMLRAGRAHPSLIRDRADLGWIVDVADELSRVPRHSALPQIALTIFSSLSSALLWSM